MIPHINKSPLLTQQGFYVCAEMTCCTELADVNQPTPESFEPRSLQVPADQSSYPCTAAMASARACIGCIVDCQGIPHVKLSVRQWFDPLYAFKHAATRGEILLRT